MPSGTEHELSDKDILGKADALLRRHSVAAPGSGSDTGGVPVLTDLVRDLAAAEAARQASALTGAAPESAALRTTDDAAAQIAREVFTRVMAQVEGRLAAELERRVVEHLVPQVHAAVASALGDLHQELANAIGDAIAEALAGREAK
jgi:hypothetical protein